MILKKIEEKFETNSFHINLSNYCEKNCYHCFNWSIDKIKKNNILENIENYFEYALLHIKNMNKLLNIKLNEFQFMGESFFYDLSKKEYEYFFEIFDKYTNIFKEFNQRFQYSFHTCLNKPLNKDLLNEMIKRKDILMLDIFFYPDTEVLNNEEIENNIKEINQLIHVEVTAFLTKKLSQKIIKENYLAHLKELNGNNISIPPYEENDINIYPDYKDIFLVDNELKKYGMLFEIVVNNDYIFANTELTFYIYNNKVTYHQTINYDELFLDISNLKELKEIELNKFIKKSINKNVNIKIKNIIEQDCIKCKYLPKCMGGYIFKNKSYYNINNGIKECNGFINLRK